ncbi:MAG: class I SAM-dependent methyltransferase [Scrofimicrobium sp.]
MTDNHARADLDKDPEQVAAMFDAVAPNYDFTNDLISLGQVFIWRRAVNQAIKVGPGDQVLDVAAGTGTSSMALRKTGAQVVAVDLSPGMIEVGRTRNPEIDFVLGSVTDLPFEDDSFDAVTISFGLRNVDQVNEALSEMVRVTRPGGVVLVCEFSKPKPIVAPFESLYLEFVAPNLARFASPAGEAYDYLSESIFDWHDQQTLGQMMQRAGLEDVGYRNLTFGAVAMHRGYKPGPHPLAPWSAEWHGLQWEK